MPKEWKCPECEADNYVCDCENDVVLDEIIDKYKTALNILKENKNIDTITKYPYDTDIKNCHEFVRDLKKIKNSR